MNSLSWTGVVALLLLLVALSPARAETGVTPTTILIGQSVSLSGPTGLLGQEMQAGAAATKPMRSSSMESYLSARIPVDGLRRAGRDLTREKLIAALETMHDASFGGFRFDYSRTNHAASRFVELTVIGKDGTILR